MSLNPSQRELFDAPPWQIDDHVDRLVARIIFSAGPTEGYDYLVPDPLRESIAPGKRVRVPFGRANRLQVGYCVQLESRPLGTQTLKSLAAIVDRQVLLSPRMLDLTRWIADRYLCPWGQVLDAVVPAGVREQSGTRETTLLSVSPEILDRIDKLELPPKQVQVLTRLARLDRPLGAPQLARLAGCTVAPINALRKKGLLVAFKSREFTPAEPGANPTRDTNLILNPAQQNALTEIITSLQRGAATTFLLYGVTGSGKTEVYMQAIAEVLRYGRQAIVLVPEISLTPQTVARFRSRFGEVAVLHSHLTDADRHRHWQKIASGRVSVVVGARSAIFAPTPHLGLIVIDEEHESTFKQETAPRYHARDVALERARSHGIPLVLGSATPALESWQAATRGDFHLLRLPHRVEDRPLPAVGTIDLRLELDGEYRTGAISRVLRRAMEQSLAEGGQVILLLNRRGFATHIQCPACGLVLRCPSCELALTHQRAREIALCHYCDYQCPAPTRCPNCNSPEVRYAGRGTQRLEAEVRALFPDFRALRMDSDSMQSAKSYEQGLDAFRSGDVRILLGTQMIAKGLDFPDVTLVGVVNADTALHLPDFRAAERTFQLLTQVAGRTGRGPRGGRVLVQTLNPDHPAVRAAVKHDFEAFAAQELPLREMLGYPPYGSLIRLVVRGPKSLVAEEFTSHIAAELRKRLASDIPPVRVLGPAPAPLAKLRDLYRFQIQLQGPSGALLRAAVTDVTVALNPPDDVQWIADVDPVSML